MRHPRAPCAATVASTDKLLRRNAREAGCHRAAVIAGLPGAPTVPSHGRHATGKQMKFPAMLSKDLTTSFLQSLLV
jgi:hypothetical protein